MNHKLVALCELYLEIDSTLPHLDKLEKIIHDIDPNSSITETTSRLRIVRKNIMMEIDDILGRRIS